MALTDRLAGIVSSVFVLVALVVAGCQAQRAETPTIRVEMTDGERARPPSPEAGRVGLAPPKPVEAEVGGASPTLQPATSTAAGTIEPSGPAVELALKFAPGRTATYKLTTELQKSVEWKGSAASKPAKFTDGRTGNHIELTFEQKVRQVQNDGAATLEVTIKGVKYVGEVVNKVVLDFDSARPADSASPLAALVGQSYQVKMSPKGQVLEISGVEAARQAMQGGGPGQNVALRLLSDDEIRNRHEIATLSALKESTARAGQTWSSVRTFSFDDLGAKTYERVYTLKGSGGASPTLQTANSKDRLAVVEMKAIPSAARATELHQGPANPFARMSDNTDSYDGRLVLDPDAGQVREYAEQMYNEWIIADPSSMQTGQPTAIKMAAKRLHRMELVQ